MTPASRIRARWPSGAGAVLLGEGGRRGQRQAAAPPAVMAAAGRRMVLDMRTSPSLEWPLWVASVYHATGHPAATIWPCMGPGRGTSSPASGRSLARTLGPMDAADWLRTELASFGCAACGQAYGQERIRVLAERDGLFFVDLACAQCGSQAMAIVTIQVEGGSRTLEAGELLPADVARAETLRHDSGERGRRPGRASAAGGLRGRPGGAAGADCDGETP